MEVPEIITAKSCECHCGDYTKVLPVETGLYADPPYNSREYLPNYHVMETIARYDSPIIKGVTGIREYTEKKSAFCKKATVHDAFVKLIKDANSRYVLISYNNEEDLFGPKNYQIFARPMGTPKTFKLIEMDYRRYKIKSPTIQLD